LVGGGSGVSVGVGGTGVGVSVGGRGVGVSAGGIVGVEVGRLFNITTACPPVSSDDTAATLPGVGVKVGQGVRVMTETVLTGSPAKRVPSLSVRPHPRLTRVRTRARPRNTCVRLRFIVFLLTPSKLGQMSTTLMVAHS
jgi:hypothetical protein